MWNSFLEGEGEKGGVSLIKDSSIVAFNTGVLRKLSKADKIVVSKLRREGTKAEERLWSLIRKDQFLGTRFRRQHKIGQFILDFFSMKCQLAIEVDGEIHAQQIQQDAERSQWLESQGIRVIRFSNDEVFADPERIRAKIEKVVAERLRLHHDPRETPSLEGEGAKGGVNIHHGWNELGQSHEGRPIRAYANFSIVESDSTTSADWTLILGGTHGDERATVSFLEAFIADHLEYKLEGKMDLGPVMVIPVLNPDGYERKSRYNARGVDLNRNFPELWSREGDEPSGSEPLSEPEARLLHDLLMTAKPSRIVSLHWALSEIDVDGERGNAWALDMWEDMDESHRCLFRLREPDGGSSLPGSLGTFCRRRLGETAILMTLELPYHYEPELDPLPDDHFTTVGVLWEEDRERYWNAVYPAVEKILRYAAGSRN